MDDSFRDRVEKVFGSLAPSKSSPWSLTDDEVERREWRRGTDTSDRDNTPCSAAFDEFFRKEGKVSRKLRRVLREDVDDPDGGGEPSDGSFGGNEGDREEWEIRSSIGLDSTLDREEEEDEYDKVATGRENAGDRLFMSDITNHGSYLNSHNVLSNPLHSTAKDPRANHLAARIRLKEDEVEAQKCDSSHLHDSEVKGQHVEAAEDCNQPRSILKRKDNNAVSKSPKRVRFDPGCGYGAEEAAEKFTSTSLVEATVSDEGSLMAQNASGVPDYLLNPSKYTRYSFDSASEIDEQSNVQSCITTLNMVKELKPSESGLEAVDSSADLPKSVTFIPKKKASDSSILKQQKEEDHKQSLHGVVFPVGIAAGEANQEVGALEEDGRETNAADTSAGSERPGRRYRTKSRSDDNDS